METEKDRFGEKMRLVECAKEDIYFAQRDRQLLEKLRSDLRRVEKSEETPCPKCSGSLEGYTFQEVALDRCNTCEGIWLDKGELETIARKINRGPLGAWIDMLTAKT